MYKKNENLVEKKNTQMIIFFIFLIIFQIILSYPLCIEGENNCLKCNPITKFCIKCKYDYLRPDLEGGCNYSQICQFGKNNCLKCSEGDKLCQICEDDYFPDEIGGCSYTDNCQISKYGKCIKCKNNYILIGLENYEQTGINICKSLNTEDLQNCESINRETGICYFCKKGFYLNSGDKKCINIENCYESSYGICNKCNNGYYLDKVDNNCKQQNGIFSFCKESNNGEQCSLCETGYFLTEKGSCSYINYCKLLDNDSRKCKKCISGYYVTGDGYSCTHEKNCLSGDKNFGICYLCKENYYFEIKDKKCKSNQEENDLKYCQIAEDGICKKCITEYAIGEDHKCSSSYDCKKSINNTCVECIDHYHLSLNNICTDVEHCIYASFFVQGCVECEEDYYFSSYNIECEKAEGNFTNCKSSGEDPSFCQKCKDNYYINITDNLCYSNNVESNFYKCSEVNKTEDENPIYKCLYCIDNYYLGNIDNKCSRIEGCDLSENENKCIECDGGYCLDLSTYNCIPNDEIKNENKKFYFRCKVTNEEGSACKECIDDYILDENGLCINDENCIEKKDGICQRCQNNEFGLFCLNKYFGCEEIYDKGCMECNNIFDLFECTKCLDGYELDNNNKCIEIDEDI